MVGEDKSRVTSKLADAVRIPMKPKISSLDHEDEAGDVCGD
jgi:hypothetical protein